MSTEGFLGKKQPRNVKIKLAKVNIEENGIYAVVQIKSHIQKMTHEKQPNHQKIMKF